MSTLVLPNDAAVDDTVTAPDGTVWECYDAGPPALWRRQASGGGGGGTPSEFYKLRYVDTGTFVPAAPPFGFGFDELEAAAGTGLTKTTSGTLDVDLVERPHPEGGDILMLEVAVGGVFMVSMKTEWYHDDSGTVINEFENAPGVGGRFDIVLADGSNFSGRGTQVASGHPGYAGSGSLRSFEIWELEAGEAFLPFLYTNYESPPMHMTSFEFLILKVGG